MPQQTQQTLLLSLFHSFSIPETAGNSPKFSSSYNTIGNSLTTRKKNKIIGMLSLPHKNSVCCETIRQLP